MEKTTKETDALPVPVAEIERIGKMLSRLGEKYAEAVAECKSLGCEALRIEGLKSAVRGEGYLRGWLKTIAEAIDDESVKPSTIGKQIGRKAARDAKK